jgi:cyclin B
MLRFSNSNLAASALYLSLKMTRNSNPWTNTLMNHTHYSEQAVRPCAKDLFLLIQDAQTSTLEAVKKKFMLPKYGEVSRIRLEHSNNTPSTAPSS